MKKFALIVAGGSGLRMNAGLPKQFVELDGKPVLMHTIGLFWRFDPETELVVVLPPAEMENWEKLCHKHLFQVHHRLVAGGDTRFESVNNGLKLVPDGTIVFIHDGVRPLVSEKTLSRCFEGALRQGCAIPVLPVVESLRQVSPNGSQTVNRNDFVSVQTPQTFRSEEIKKAYNCARSHLFTDDASVYEAAGLTVHLVEGNRENIKLTFPEDIALASAQLKISDK